MPRFCVFLRLAIVKIDLKWYNQDIISKLRLLTVMAKLIQYCTEGSKLQGEFKWQAAGMGYVILTDNGKLSVIDGGHRADAKPLVELIKEVSGKDVPTVDLWIITHPHGDHFGALAEISENEALLKTVKIKELCFKNPEEFYWGKPENRRSLCRELNEMKELASRLGAMHHIPETDETVILDSLKIKFYYVTDAADEPSDPNELSLVFSVEGANKKVMFTGDAYKKTLLMALERYGDELKSDAVQLAHHALNGGSTEFYRAVDAKIAFVPISEPGDLSMKEEKHLECNRHNRFAAENAETLYKAYNGNAEIEI